jgi:hypothetical protein
LTYKRDARYYRYAQFATAYAFSFAMKEAGVDTETLLDINWIANTEWDALLEEYENTIKEIPDNTRDQMGDLLFQDLMEQFQKLADDIGGGEEDA